MECYEQIQSCINCGREKYKGKWLYPDDIIAKEKMDDARRGEFLSVPRNDWDGCPACAEQHAYLEAYAHV